MDGMDAHSLCRMQYSVCSRKEIQEKQIVVKNHRKSLKEKKRACEKTRVFSFVLLLIVIIIAILHKKGYSSPYPIRMIL